MFKKASDKLKLMDKKFKREVKTYQLVLKHSRTPKLAKWLLGLALGYALMPFDLIPDFIPVFGYLDDAIILPGLVMLAYKVTPKDIIEECRREVEKGQ